MNLLTINLLPFHARHGYVLVTGTVTPFAGAGELSMTRTDVEPAAEAIVTPVIVSVLSLSAAVASDALGAAPIAYGRTPPLIATFATPPDPTVTAGGTADNWFTTTGAGASVPMSLQLPSTTSPPAATPMPNNTNLMFMVAVP